MKKLLISFMFCCGVGLTMMGSPAQASDDNNQNNTVVTNCESISSTNGSMAVVSEQPNKPTHHGCLGLRHECKKRIDVSTLPAPKRITLTGQVNNRTNLKKKSTKKLPYTNTGKIQHLNSEPQPTLPLVER